SEHVTAFMIDLFESPDPWKRPEQIPRADDLLRRGAAEIGDSLEGQPAVRARLLESLGKAMAELGDPLGALPLQTRALELRREVFGQRHPEVASSLAALGDLQSDLGHYDEAVGLLGRALDLRRELLGSEDLQLARTLLDLAACLARRTYGDPEPGPFYEEAYSILRRSLGEDASETLAAQLSLGIFLRSIEEDERALQLIRGVVERLGRPGAVEDPELSFKARSHLAISLRIERRFDEAEAIMREQLALARDRLGERHPTTVRGQQILAGILRRAGKPRETLEVSSRSAAIYREIYGEDSPQAASANRDLLLSTMQVGDLERAEPLARQILEVFEKHHGAENVRVIDARWRLAAILEGLERLEEAAKSYRAALEGARAVQPASQTLGAILGSASSLDLRLRRFEDAEAKAREGIAIFADHFPDSPSVLIPMNALGSALRAQGRLEQAEEELLRAYHLGNERTKQVPILLHTVTELVALYEQLGDRDEAARYRREVVALEAKL
ncbi:MAG: tetratricopeptide repeat protein, partial [Holophagales bacterium]|nr:tetratricopeptide repeat protein [Holophagales bacterium]